MVIAQLTITPSEICGIILGDTCAHVYNPLYNWSLPLSPIPKPPINPIPIDPATPTRTPSGTDDEPRKTLKVLQLSDTHIDLEYLEGGDAVCGEPLCCREPSPERSSGHHGHHGIPADDKAGYWGDYRDCDIPLRTLESMLQFINANHDDLDLVFWTGDVPAHDVWNQTRSGQISLIRTVSNLMTKYLGHVPILPALGNHESAPVNRYRTFLILLIHSIFFDTIQLFTAFRDPKWKVTVPLTGCTRPSMIFGAIGCPKVPEQVSKSKYLKYFDYYLR